MTADHLSRSARNFFAAGPGDRLADRRRDPQWALGALGDAGARFVVVWRERSLLLQPGDRARLLEAAELPAEVDLGNAAVLLGEHEGRPHFAIELELDDEQVGLAIPPDSSFADLRRVGAALSEREGALLAYARAMLYWHRRHRYCGECGAPTRSAEAGHLRVCTDDECGARHFPRTDPAIIVLTADASGERCLLGRHAAWLPGMYSCLAGFVEPGETLEHAVVREVREEAGIDVTAVEYRSSQPWPFPSSLMLGFRASAVTEAIHRADEELEDARWFSRDDLARGYLDGTLRIPNRISIAFRLIEEWFDAGGEPLARVLERC